MQLVSLIPVRIFTFLCSYVMRKVFATLDHDIANLDAMPARPKVNVMCDKITNLFIKGIILHEFTFPVVSVV